MIPQVLMCWAPKQVKCKFCGESINAGTPEIVVIFNNARTTRKYYHPPCWIQYGLNNLQKSPQPTCKIILTQEQKAARLTVLKHYAALRQRQRKLSKTGLHYNILYANIEAQIAQLILDILPLGGVPKKWANNE